MHFFSSVSIQMPFPILLASMVAALCLKVRNGLQQSGFTWTLSTSLWDLREIALIQTRTVRDGLLLESAPRTQNIWLELLTSQATVESPAKNVNIKYIVQTPDLPGYYRKPSKKPLTPGISTGTPNLPGYYRKSCKKILFLKQTLPLQIPFIILHSSLLSYYALCTVINSS